VVLTSRRVAILAALAPLGLAALALLAWLTGALRLASLRTEYIPMAPSTAIGFLVVGTAIVGRASRDNQLTRRLAGLAAVYLSVLATITVIEFSSDLVAFNLERLLVADPGEFGAVPLGRMSPLTALAFLVTGVSLGLLARDTRGGSRSVAGLLGTCVGLGGGTVMLGYVYGAPPLYGGRVIPMALTTAVGFIGTSVALVAVTGPTALPLRPLSGSSARARLLRAFVPWTVGAILTNGVLTHVILSRVEANPGLLAALFALLSALVVGAVVSERAGAVGGAIDRAEHVLTRSRDELEQAVRARTAELVAVNRELEAFSYSVSHDLRAPLRHVLGFAAALETDAGARLDERGRRHLGKVVEAAQRMSRLIDDLLALSRTARVALEKRLVNLAELVRDAQTEVVSQVPPERRIEWRVQNPMPDVAVDPAVFHLALVNLLSNAAKYTAREPHAVIDIGTLDGNATETVIFVRDNGVGFDMAYAGKLFGVFQRLHRNDEFEGTGVGLANVSRIVHRHGGRVWAEAEPGKGATFYLAIPTRP
jgi:signal transduction histidine kinase